jgi:hypothetical protein
VIAIIWLGFPEGFVTLRLTFLFVIITLNLFAGSALGQVDSVLAQLSSSAAESFAGGISGNGRFVVFESRGDLATENPRNADNNLEIFLFDYAQRRIYQITDTKSLLFNTASLPIFSNIRVEITNTRPVISNDGRWIAFSSNATTSRPEMPDKTNPSFFDANAFTSPTPTPSPTATPTPTGSPTGSPTATPTPSPTATPAANPLTEDGNLEMWIYQIPAYPEVADLSAGDEIPAVNLAGGTFIRVSNTEPSQFPRPGTSTTGPFIAEDNHDASISDDGNVIAFVSTRDLVPCPGPDPCPNGNQYPEEDNDEIFTYVRSISTVQQVTKTPRGLISNPIYNKNPTISGNGLRITFASTGENPIIGMTGGVNPEESRNEEIHYTDLSALGMPEGVKKQVTTTTSTNPGDPVNILDYGRRMSRDGRYIAFDSYADLAATPPGANSTAFALFVYDVTTDTFRQIGPRSDADTAATGGDVFRYPGFTDYDAGGVATTLVFETRLNITASGMVPTVAADGLNPDPGRPAQIYSIPIDPAAPQVFARLAKFPPPASLIASTQLITSNSLERAVFNLGLTELGGANFDRFTEVFYFLKPDVASETPVTISVSTGATGIPVTFATPATPTGTPTATATPTATPTPTVTPTGSPTATPSASPTATPVTPPAVYGISSGMLAIINYQAGTNQPIVARTSVGSIDRSFSLPIELSGLTMTINGYACGLKAVSQHRIEFVVPPGLPTALEGLSYPLVINNNGTIMRNTVTLVPARPDIFNQNMTLEAGGRAKLFNVTNTVQTTEPFTVRTIKRKGNRLVPSVIRVYATGIGNVLAAGFTIRIGSVTIPAASVTTNATIIEPGVYTVDFLLPASLEGAGDQPIVLTVVLGNTSYSSRLDDTTSRVRIL